MARLRNPAYGPWVPCQSELRKPVFRIRIRFLRIRIQGFFLNPDPVPDPDPGKEKTFRKAIQKNLGVPTNMVLIYLYF